MKRFLVACSFLAITITARADVVPDSGMIFCNDQEQLGEFFQAYVAKNKKWMDSLECAILPPGAEYATIEDHNVGDKSIKLLKIRLLSSGKSRRSVVGFAIRVD